jgi:uncharacterized membrane protein
LGERNGFISISWLGDIRTVPAGLAVFDCLDVVVMRIDQSVVEEIATESGMEMLNDFRDCVAGFVTGYSVQTILAYDVEKIVEKLMEKYGMDRFAALAHYTMFIEGPLINDGSPCFLRRIEPPAD